MNQIKQVQVPDMGDFQDVEIIEVHIQAGDRIESENPLITLESDKATMDVPAPFSGKVENVLIKVGDKVSEGTPIVDLQTSDDANAEEISNTDEKRDSQNLEIQQDSGNLSSSPESPENQTDSGESSKANSYSSEPELMLMPDMGDFTEVDIIEVLVKTGDQVKPEDSVITLESDKATMDVPAPLKGTIQEMFVKTGQKISKGQKIALILPDSESANQAIQKTDTNEESSVSEAPKKSSSEELSLIHI